MANEQEAYELEMQEFMDQCPDPWWDNMSRWDRASYLEYQTREAQCCHASLTTGPAFDPYMTTCDRKDGHKGPHEGWDPIGGEERMRWTGGGYCAGDELPHFITATFKPHPLALLAKASRRWFATMRFFLFHSCK